MNLKKKTQTNNTIASFFASSLTGKKLQCLTTDMGMLQLKAVGYNEGEQRRSRCGREDNN